MQNLLLIFRSTLKGKFYSLVSIFGLATAISSMVLVATLIRHETSFENMYEKGDRIYRLTWENPETGDKFATMFNPFSPQMVMDFPEVEEAARVTTAKLLFEKPESEKIEGLKSFEDLAFADPAFFNVFNFDFLQGDPKTALVEPGSIVLTKAAAEKYFGNENPLGQTLVLEDTVTLNVTGIISDMPKNTHFSFHFIVPLETLRPIYSGARFLENWGSDVVYHYIVLSEGTAPALIREQLPDFAKRHSGFDDFDIIIDFQPLKEIHFTPDLQDEVPFQDSIKNITKAPRKNSDLVLFSAGALILVLIAGFNFMNLQMSRIIGKSRQMGLFKIFGANRQGIVKFILSETIFLSFLGLGLALILIEISLPLFSGLLGVELTWENVLTPEVLVLMLGLTLALGIFSGSYPALLMGSQVPAKVLKGEFRLSQGAEKIRHSLVFLQFAVSIILIMVSFGIYSQIRYSLSVPLGFEKESILLVEGNRASVRESFSTLKARLLENQKIKTVSRGSIIPPGNLSDGGEFTPEGGNPDNPIAVRRVGVDFDYFEGLGIPLLAGRSFNENFPGDQFKFPTPDNPHTTGGIILNETAAKRAGWVNPFDAVGKTTFSEFNAGKYQARLTLTVVGVVPDIHFRSLRSEISPMAFYLTREGGTIILKIAPGTSGKVIPYIEKVWGETISDFPISLTRMEDRVENLYSQEARTLNLLSSISVLAIFVAALGLFAVTTLVTEKRTKEVGLRKVFGAKVAQVVNLLSWQFLKPVLLANLLAWPIAWLYINNWLTGFVFRFEITPVHFLVPGLIAVLIAWATVAGHTYRVARSNPIHALRYE